MRFSFSNSKDNRFVAKLHYPVVDCFYAAIPAVRCKLFRETLF